MPNSGYICLKEDDVIQFEQKKKNANIFKTFYSELAGSLVKKLLKPPLKFNSEKTKMFHKTKTKYRKIGTLMYYGRHH